MLCCIQPRGLAVSRYIQVEKIHVLVCASLVSVLVKLCSTEDINVLVAEVEGNAVADGHRRLKFNWNP